MSVLENKCNRKILLSAINSSSTQYDLVALHCDQCCEIGF